MKQWQKSWQGLKFLPLSEDVAKAPAVSQHMWYLLLQFGYFDVMIDTAFCLVSFFSRPLNDKPYKKMSSPQENNNLSFNPVVDSANSVHKQKENSINEYFVFDDGSTIIIMLY